MLSDNTIRVYEYSWLIVGVRYNNIEFTSRLKDLLAQYLTENPGCGYFIVYYDRVRFCNYVGVIGLSDITIEVLPKTDRHSGDEKMWQKMMLEMLMIGIQVKAKVTTHANISIRKYNILETYILLFLEEVERLMHEGLVKKYRMEVGNRHALNGRLLIHQHVNKNIVHAERFFVSHQVYDRDNIFNALIGEALHLISSIPTSSETNSFCRQLLLDFPECRPINVIPAHFERLMYDRKTNRYRVAMEFARIILLNFHPDVKGGSEHILAIMFDMNLLWETYIFAMLTRAKKSLSSKFDIWPQKVENFWLHPDKWSLHLKPDIVINRLDGDKETVIVDTKWKFNADTSTEDVRQLYAYGHYFRAGRRYLLYPDNNIKVEVKEGKFYDVHNNEYSEKERCGLLFVNPFTQDKNLDYSIGGNILVALFGQDC